jgi:hypothetical protein
MRVAGRTSRSLCVVLLLSAGWALPAQNAVRRAGNVAPVHGALVDGSGCRGLHDILARDGYDGARFPSDLVPLDDSPAASSLGSPALDERRPPRDPCGKAGPGQPPAERVPDQVRRFLLIALLRRLPGGEQQGGQGLHAIAVLLSRPRRGAPLRSFSLE